MNLITSQNNELSNELQRFLQTDEVVKTKLNRRQTVDEIRHKVDTAIRRSQHEVEQRRSPRKSSQGGGAGEDRLCYRHASRDRSTSNNARNSAAIHHHHVTTTSYSNNNNAVSPVTGNVGCRPHSPLRSKSPQQRH